MPESYSQENELIMCENCDKADACFTRTDEIATLWIFEDQLDHCLEEGKPSYEDDDFWMVKEVQSEGG